MPPNEQVLYHAVSYARLLIRAGEQPARAAAFAPALALDANQVRTLATDAETACRQTRAQLQAEKAARIARGESEAAE
jgi:hypothetical protein